MFMLLLLVLVPIVALVALDVLALRWGAESRDWQSTGEWRWRRRSPASDL